MANNNTALSARLKGIISSLPKTHALLIGLAVATVFFATLLPSAEVQANRRPMAIATDIDPNPQLALTTLTNPVLSEPTLANEKSQPEWKELVVRKGDNLAKLFDRAGASASDLNDVLQLGADAKTLKQIFPGQKLSFQIDANGQLIALRYEESQLKTTNYYREQNNFVAEKVNREPEVRQQFTNGTITSSLYKAGIDAGLSDGMILQLAEIFGGEIDFALDLRTNDHFSVMYDAYYLDGKKIGNGPILAVTFTNDGETHTAFRYVYANGEEGYFSADGTSMRKTFMRAPLDVIRITSSFSTGRYHPVLKITRPHRGIDYGAPTGTPVYAAGDGRVVQSGFNPSMGNFVMIQHGGSYATKYLHLSKRSVKVGDRVRQHQTIGAVGSTGLASGPHLHYEFLVNGVHTNPAKIAGQLPKAERIAASELRRFSEQVRNLQTQFTAYAQNQNTSTGSDNVTANASDTVEKTTTNL
ncbi:MAG: peptidoglycan DD-metalloendopeptidase family protein [Spongiibacteraceae bacterium]